MKLTIAKIQNKAYFQDLQHIFTTILMEGLDIEDIKYSRTLSLEEQVILYINIRRYYNINYRLLLDPNFQIQKFKWKK